ncbi:MAG: ECF-type riboflavin transporter substrate-binding protein [Actinomycetaceae bacterium]|nr:ECF-type riboflavin transporter substrate-binding protein [Actinomycetaceae bacterium]
MNKTSPVTAVVATGIGAALFFVLGRFAVIPTPVPNTTINLQYALIAVFALLYGPVVAGLMGFIGHFLIDATSYGPWWSWIVASAIAGLIMGFMMMKDRVQEDGIDRAGLVRFNVAIVIAHAVAWIVIAPVLDIVIYSEPASKVFTQGAVAGISNVLTTAIIGTLIVIAYAKTRTSAGSLQEKE